MSIKSIIIYLLRQHGDLHFTFFAAYSVHYNIIKIHMYLVQMWRNLKDHPPDTGHSPIIIILKKNLIFLIIMYYNKSILFTLVYRYEIFLNQCKGEYNC